MMRQRRLLCLVLLLFVAAPTAGDIGSCGQPLEDLDAVKFFSEKQFIDCAKCLTCGFDTVACEEACSEVLQRDSFEPDCFPVVHDGEVCLNALRASKCEVYAKYIDDAAPTVPTECLFCPPDRKPAPEEP